VLEEVAGPLPGRRRSRPARPGLPANLAWKLAGSVQGRAPPGLLDTYSEERRAAERTLLHTPAQVALRRGYGPGGDALRALSVELTADEQPLRLGEPAPASG
jgi:hypothetical protein